MGYQQTTGIYPGGGLWFISCKCGTLVDREDEPVQDRDVE